MKELIILFGGLVIIIMAMMMIKPAAIVDLINKRLGSTSLYLVAISTRILLGAVLIGYASFSKFPLTLQILGYLALLAALVFILIGKANFNRFIQFILSYYTPALGRIAALFALIFGLFLIYAVA